MSYPLFLYELRYVHSPVEGLTDALQNRLYKADNLMITTG
jgi:hypothetical protein